MANRVSIFILQYQFILFSSSNVYFGSILHLKFHFFLLQDKHLICLSVNTTRVSCTLENPFKKQSKDSAPIIMRFDARGLDDSEPSVIFSVWANSTSRELHPGKIPVKLEALVIKNAELSIKG